MKRKLLFGAAFLFIAWAATACEKRCKVCKNVTYENGIVTNTGPQAEYCGADLLAKEAIPDVVIGSLTTKVECH